MSFLIFGQIIGPSQPAATKLRRQSNCKSRQIATDRSDDDRNRADFIRDMILNGAQSLSGEHEVQELMRHFPHHF